jgi:hypothetical protein
MKTAWALGVGLPLALAVLPLLNHQPADWHLALLLIPAAVAALMEAVARRTRWTVPAAPPSAVAGGARRTPSTARSCLLLALIAMGVTSVSFVY